MKQKKRVALYYSVSRADQSITMQQADLRRYAKARGLTIYKEYSDEGVSGTKAKRPALDRLMVEIGLSSPEPHSISVTFFPQEDETTEEEDDK